MSAAHRWGKNDQAYDGGPMVPRRLTQAKCELCGAIRCHHECMFRRDSQYGMLWTKPYTIYHFGGKATSKEPQCEPEATRADCARPHSPRETAT